MSGGGRVVRYAGTAVVMLVVLGLAFCGRGHAAQNLLRNGDFSVGSGDSVDGWMQQAWVEDAGSTDYHWTRPAKGKAGELEVFSHRDNDARWQQPVSLPPGWYYISADVRTHGVLGFSTGANISVLDGGIASADLKGDTDWHRLGFYLKVGPRGGDVDVALRLGGFGNLTRGQAFFRDASVVRIDAPPPNADRLFDLVAVRKAAATPPLGQPWTLVATALLLAAIAALGWWLMGEPALPPAVPIAAPPPVAPPAASKRRKRARGR